MKKLLILMMIPLIITSLPKEINPESNYNIFSDEEYYESNTNVDIFPLNGEYHLKEDNNNIYVVNSTELELITNGKIIDSLYDDNYIYLIVKKGTINLIKYDIVNKKIIKNIQYDLDLRGLKLINDEIYLFGSFNGDAGIRVVDKNFEELNNITYGGDGLEIVTNLTFNDDALYLGIYRDALSNDSPFISYNNKYQEKSMIVKTDYDFNIMDTLYLDEGGNDEYLKELFVINDLIYFSLCCDDTYFYLVNLDLKILNKKQQIGDYYELIPNYKDERFLYIVLREDLSVVVDDDVIYSMNGRFIYDSLVINDTLYVYADSENGYKIEKIKEYEIIAKSPLHVNRYYMEPYNTNHLSVKSFFGLLDIKLSKIESNFDKSINGTYLGRYLVNWDDSSNIEITENIIIEEYTNFINGGMYQTGFRLEFFGNASINGERVYNGTIMDTPGEYDIDVYSIDGSKKTYHIYVRDNYYNPIADINIPCDAYTTNKEYQIKYELSDSNKISIDEIYINGEPYTNYSLNNNILNIKFYEENRGIYAYHLDKIIYQLGGIKKELIINKLYTIKYYDETPEVNCVKTLYKDYSNVVFNFNDYKRNILYLKVTSSNGYYLVDTNMSFNNIKDIKIDLIYLDETNTIKEVPLYVMNQDSNFTTDIVFNNQNGYIKNIEINSKIAKGAKKINKFIVNEQDMLTYYQVSNEFPLLTIIIIISAFIVLGFVILILIKRNKKRKGVNKQI